MRPSKTGVWTRHFGWLLLHGALRCGAASVHWCAAESEQGLWDAVCCRQQACAAAAVLPGGRVVPALADFSHTCLHCPASRPAVQWLCDMWARIAPADSPVPVDARVLLLGDLDIWMPSGGYGPEALWLHLRLLLCRAIWLLACKARAGEPVTWQGVVAVTRAWVARAIRQDWLRVSDTLPRGCRAALLVCDRQTLSADKGTVPGPLGPQRHSCSH